MSKLRAILSSVFIVLILSIWVGVFVANLYAEQYKSIISIYMGHPTSKIVGTDPNADTNYFKSDYATYNELYEAEVDIAQRIQAEGSVLLKNENNALPLTGSNLQVTLLGTSSVDFLYGGGGAGSIDTRYSPTLKEAFEQAGYEVNPTVWEFYANGDGRHYRRSNSSAGLTVGEAPVATYGVEEINSFSSYGDAAVIVIGRFGTETSDLPLSTTEDSNKHALEFSQDELDLIQLASNNFDTVIILLNTLNAFELGAVDSLGVDAVLWIGAGGQQGLLAIPKMLDGRMYPSGQLVNTYAYDALSSPAMTNFGNLRIENSTVPNGNSYLVYLESIYVGYKYYETRYEDVVLGTSNVGSFDYSAAVQYPFGYGLDYTTYEKTNYNLTDNGDHFTATVTVRNTGTHAGKEVVQIYLQQPYTAYDIENKVEKAAVQLVGFAKTDELAPNQSQTLSITIPKESLKAYDANGYGTYIVDAGNYHFALGENAHDALNNILAAKMKTTADGMDYNGNPAFVKTYTQNTLDATTYAVSVATGNSITNQFEEADMRYYDDSITYLTRSNWTGTWPETYATTTVMQGGQIRPAITASEQFLQDLLENYVTDPDAVMPTTGTTSTEFGHLNLIALQGVDYDNPFWDVLLDQLTAQEMIDLIGLGGYSTIAMESIAKPGTIDKDGPAGISSTLVGGAGAFGYPVATVIASTWNRDIAEEMGTFVGEDGLRSETHGWYAPSMNIHRTPFAGRNFEYFSEDGFISGKFGAAIVEGVQSKGVYAYIKHFAFNDQETNRAAVATFGTEQSLREIYLLPFELSVREGNAHAAMAAMNRVGATWVGAHKGLMTEILRNEWKFQGMVITDQASIGGDYQFMRTGLVAGNDLWLNTDASRWNMDDYDFANDATLMTAMRQATKNILFTVVNSSAMNGISAESRVVNIVPTWQIWLFIADGIIGVGGVAGLFFIGSGMYKSIKKNKKATV